MRDKKVNDVNDRKADAQTIGFEPLISVAQAARMLGLKEPTLYGWIEDGKFEGLKIGVKAVRVRPEAVRAFLAAAKEVQHSKAA
jgi:excisionase family DNA binding protein